MSVNEALQAVADAIKTERSTSRSAPIYPGRCSATDKAMIDLMETLARDRARP